MLLGITEPSQLAGDCPSPQVSVEGLFWSTAPSSETAATKQKKFQGKISEMPCLPTTSIFLRVKLSIIFQSALLTSAWLLLSPQGPAHAGETSGVPSCSTGSPQVPSCTAYCGTAQNSPTLSSVNSAPSVASCSSVHTSSFCFRVPVKLGSGMLKSANVKRKLLYCVSQHTSAPPSMHPACSQPPQFLIQPLPSISCSYQRAFLSPVGRGLRLISQLTMFQDSILPGVTSKHTHSDQHSLGLSIHPAPEGSLQPPNMISDRPAPQTLPSRPRTLFFPSSFSCFLGHCTPLLPELPASGLNRYSANRKKSNPLHVF